MDKKKLCPLIASLPSILHATDILFVFCTLDLIKIWLTAILKSIFNILKIIIIKYLKCLKNHCQSVKYVLNYKN